MSVTATVLLDVMDLSVVFCVADSGILQDTFLWNSVRMHTCSVWFSNTTVLLAMVVESSRVFHAVDSVTLQVTHRRTPAPYGTLVVLAVLPTHSF